MAPAPYTGFTLGLLSHSLLTTSTFNGSGLGHLLLAGGSGGLVVEAPLSYAMGFGQRGLNPMLC